MDLHQSKLYFEDVDRAIKHVIGIEKLVDKSILITGATGTIGSFVTDVLIRFNLQNSANIKIYIAGRNLEKMKKKFNDGNVEFLKYNMNSSVEFDIQVD